MQSVLGSNSETIHFDPTQVYTPNGDLQSLQDPFTVGEIDRAVRRLAKHKASGPDGLPNEFLQTQWPALRDAVIPILHGFYDHSIDLQQLNRAHLIMIPKTDLANRVDQFRPISVLNLIPKLISKILADRLRAFLPDLISPSQTAFVRGRQISENFIATREIMQHIASGTKPAVFVKIDFAKAFDSVNWDFLMRVLQARGFPAKWITWISSMLRTSSSCVVINGEKSDFFPHRQGLRQGDPLSPMLFNLVVDVLQQMIGIANGMINSPIANKLTDSIIAMQYADDTAIIAGTDVKILVTLKLVLRLFTAASGLKINYVKSSFVPINVHTNNLDLVTQVLSCKQVNFPVQYLGMPLMITNPGRPQFMPLIEKLEKQLEGWKGKLISRGGRLQLVNSVLSAIPIYFMACFRFPKWVLKRIDKIRRVFLWGKSDGNSSGISLLNWEAVCVPTKWGGLGVADLELRNISLLLRWWWRLYSEPDSLWTEVATKIRWTGAYPEGPRLWAVNGSFFWRQLMKIKHIFHWSTEWIIGDGMSISFWFDSWNGQPLADLRDTNSRPAMPNCSLRDAAPIMLSLAPDIEVLHPLTFLFCRDEIRWRWTSNGRYSSKPVYEVLIGGGRVKWGFSKIWKFPVPQTVKIFLNLMLQNKILTHDTMIRRRIYVELGCVLCNNCPMESCLHLFFLCPYATAVWFSLSILTGQMLMRPAMSVEQIWNESEQRCIQRYGSNNNRRNKKIWEARFGATCWLLWKQRNRVIFGEGLNPPQMLANDVVVESQLWLNCIR